ncbi:MAG: LacI family DNA-binding transcriptional regulator [Actinomycetota bacterium]|nr:LacI family DNA-binding transcriptional regulator [Actinomycetota bacterium]
MTRLRDVAERAGVSVSVVSRVLSEDPSLRVRDDTRARVLEAVRDLGYTQNHAGRALRLRWSGAVALLVPDMNNAIFAEVSRGVEAAAAEADLVTLLGRSEWLDPENGRAARLCQQGRVDGLIVQLRDEERSPEILDLLPPGVPAVLINWHQHRGISSVAVDDEEAGRLATAFLLELGHREIGLVGGFAQTSTARARETGYRKALADAGVTRREAWTTRLGYTPEAGRAAFARLIDTPPLPTAVVVSNVNAAAGVLAAARDAAISVPEQLSVVTVHDTWIADHTNPALTAVRVPTYELGAESARTLTRVMHGERKQHVLVDDPPPLLVPRGTHAPGPHA